MKPDSRAARSVARRRFTTDKATHRSDRWRCEGIHSDVRVVFLSRGDIGSYAGATLSGLSGSARSGRIGPSEALHAVRYWHAGDDPSSRQRAFQAAMSTLSQKTTFQHAIPECAYLGHHALLQRRTLRAAGDRIGLVPELRRCRTDLRRRWVERRLADHCQKSGAAARRADHVSSHQPGRAVSRPQLRAFARSGEFVAFLDADDYWAA